MSIVSSVIESISPQADGLRYVVEAHTDDKGGLHRLTVLRDATVDDDAELAKHAAQLQEDG